MDQRQQPNIREIHYSVERVCPIYGVRILDPFDQATWSIDFREEATPEQRDAAMQALLNYGKGDENPENVGSPTVIR